MLFLLCLCSCNYRWKDLEEIKNSVNKHGLLGVTFTRKKPETVQRMRYSDGLRKIQFYSPKQRPERYGIIYIRKILGTPNFTNGCYTNARNSRHFIVLKLPSAQSTFGTDYAITKAQKLADLQYSATNCKNFQKGTRHPHLHNIQWTNSMTCGAVKGQPHPLIHQIYQRCDMAHAWWVVVNTQPE